MGHEPNILFNANSANSRGLMQGISQKLTESHSSPLLFCFLKVKFIVKVKDESPPDLSNNIDKRNVRRDSYVYKINKSSLR